MFAGFRAALRDQHQVARLHQAAVHAVRRDHEIAAGHPRRKAALRADEEALAVRAPHELAEIAAHLSLQAGGRSGTFQIRSGSHAPAGQF